VSSRDPASPIYNINSTAVSNRAFFVHVPQTTLGQLRFGDQTAIITGCPVASFPGCVGGEKAFPTPTQPGNEARAVTICTSCRNTECDRIVLYLESMCGILDKMQATEVVSKSMCYDVSSKGLRVSFLWSMHL